MANTLGIFFADDVGEFAIDMPATFVWAGQSITGSRSEWARDLDAQAEGILNAERAEFICKIADFTGSTLPNTNVDVTLDGTAAHIVAKREDHDGVVVVFELRRIA